MIKIKNEDKLLFGVEVTLLGYFYSKVALRYRVLNSEKRLKMRFFLTIVCLVILQKRITKEKSFLIYTQGLSITVPRGNCNLCFKTILKRSINQFLRKLFHSKLLKNVVLKVVFLQDSILGVFHSYRFD